MTDEITEPRWQSVGSRCQSEELLDALVGSAPDIARELARQWLLSSDRTMRLLAVTIAGEMALRFGQSGLGDELVRIIWSDTEPDVLHEAIAAAELEHIVQALPAVRSRAASADPGIRHIVASAIGSLVDESGEGIGELVMLTADRSSTVRRAAVFRLTQWVHHDHGRDQVALESLAQRLGDRTPDIVADAAIGLAIAGDLRGHRAIEALLSGDPDSASAVRDAAEIHHLTLSELGQPSTTGEL
jgi:hypothetical protein